MVRTEGNAGRQLWTSGETGGHGPIRFGNSCLVGMLMLLPSLTGCSGCRPDKPSDEETPKERLESFESGELQVLPTDGTRAAYGVKPGHWYNVRQQLKSNKANFDGGLEATTTGVTRKPLALSYSNVSLRSRRPASLPKGQAKSFELTYFVPHSAARRRRVGLNSDLQNRYGGSTRLVQPQITNRLRAHQAFFVVLARNPDEYAYVKTLESIQPPSDEMKTGEVAGDYVVVLPLPQAGVTVPSWSMMWSSVAYLMWDDFDPEMLSRDQQRSMVDWLHWGGQLIVSAPGSLETLRASFLASYLPADAGATENVSDRRLAELNSHWSVPSKDRRVDTTLSITGNAPIEAVALRLRPDAQFVPGTAELVAERRVGRGRVAVVGISLAHRQLTNWRSFDNFFNACLLRRPSRRYSDTLEAGLTSRWSDSVMTAITRHRASAEYQVEFDDDVPTLTDADDYGGRRLPNESLVTNRLRYFSRDAAMPSLPHRDQGDAGRSFDIDGYECSAHAGIAGWNDVSRCSTLARDSLTSAAGISVPDRSLIIWSLSLYLFVLVPANWTIFRALGRVEWAWVAVPVLAIIGTVAVVRLAQLDIGFARSRTEIAIVETQPEYTRAHVTRYIGLYSSLSTDYRLSFADDSAVAAPFASSTDRSIQPSRPAEFVVLERSGKRDGKVQLHGLSVSSNSTEMVHSEQMLDLQGTVRLNVRPSGLMEVVNETSYDLLHAGMFRRHRGKLEFAGLRLLKAGVTRRVQFRAIEPDQLSSAWDEVGTPLVNIPDGIKLAAFEKLAANPDRLANGDVRLIAWSDTGLPELAIEPEASQRTFWSLWVVNLKYGAPPAPRSDSNTRTDFPVEASND